jgi:type II secretory pathway pseudopilin PulG
MKDNSSAGFSYIDVMVAIVIMMVGILALISAISASMLISRGQENQLNAKQYAVSTMESIMSAKETAPDPGDPTPLGWNAVANQPAGVFVAGVREVRQNAGPDEIIGTVDDNGPSVLGLTRQIVITDLCDPDRPSTACPVPGGFPVRNRMVTVTINYFAGSLRRQEVVRTILTDYATTN